MQAVQCYEEVLGPKHTSTLMTVNNLALKKSYVEGVLAGCMWGGGHQSHYCNYMELGRLF